MKNTFENNQFVIQILAKGAFVDNSTGTGKAFLVETYTLRVNHVAHNEWSEAKSKAAKTEFKNKVCKALELNQNLGGINVVQVQLELFTVVHIRELS